MGFQHNRGPTKWRSTVKMPQVARPLGPFRWRLWPVEHGRIWCYCQPKRNFPWRHIAGCCNVVVFWRGLETLLRRGWSRIHHLNGARFGDGKSKVDADLPETILAPVSFDDSWPPVEGKFDLHKTWLKASKRKKTSQFYETQFWYRV